MPSNKNSPHDQTSERNATGLLNDYQILSREYDRILEISQKILTELTQKKDEKKLSNFLSQKLEIGKKIELLSRKIANSNVKSFYSQKSLLGEAKKELENIQSKVNKLWDLERKIKKLIENS
jgi:hypothetical protein